MKDILPGEMEIRDYVISLIKETYRTFGFSSIETPCVEHIENLCSKQGGDNEKLIFKILKRGEKLKLAEAKEEADLVDGGLRYDLTVPLSRYYANHSNELPAPFKALQMGNVWRADRPQRGRFRQFMQCDIDILGEPSNLAEIELILATTALLGKLDFRNFTIRINDRRFLKAMAAYSGFAEEDYDNVFITLDKMDKIGLEGIAAELKENGYAEESVEKYLQLFKEITNDVAGVRSCKEKLEGFLPAEAADSLERIITSVESAKEAEFRMFFDPTLVEYLNISEDPIPNFRKLMKEYTSGYYKVPSVGAGTANTEFESITGMSLHYFGPGEYPYKSILKETTCESAPYVLKNLGYSTHAVHNNEANFYGRRSIFPNLGFDTFTSAEYMSEEEDKNPLGWTKDEILTDEIIKCLDSTEESDYIYTISTQGHGAYPEEQLIDDPEITVSGAETEAQNNQWEYYCNEIHEMDNFVKELTDALADYPEEMKKPYLLCMAIIFRPWDLLWKISRTNICSRHSTLCGITSV